jgi:hypothetical protein
MPRQVHQCDGEPCLKISQVKGKTMQYHSYLHSEEISRQKNQIRLFFDDFFANRVKSFDRVERAQVRVCNLTDLQHRSIIDITIVIIRQCKSKCGIVT